YRHSISSFCSYFIHFFFYRPVHHQYLLSFPTRRSSDLRIEHLLALVGRHLTQIADSGLHHSAAIRGKLPHLLGKSASLLANDAEDRKSTRLNSSHQIISYAVFCLKKKKINKK